MNNENASDLIVLEGLPLELRVFSTSVRRLVLRWLAAFVESHPDVVKAGISVKVSEITYVSTELLIELQGSLPDIEQLSGTIHAAVAEKLKTTSVMDFISEVSRAEWSATFCEFDGQADS